MRRTRSLWFGLAALMALICLAPAAGLANAQRSHDVAPTITMYAGPVYTPYGGTISPAHPFVVTALKVLAQKFQQQTGIQVNLIDIGLSTGATQRADWTTYMQTHIATGNAPDIMWVPGGPDQTAHNWFVNLDSAYAKPDPFLPNNKPWSDLYSNIKGYGFNDPTFIGVGNHHYYAAVAGTYPFIIIGEFYNQTLLKKVGIMSPPKDFEQWMVQLAKLKANGLNALAPNPGENKSGTVWPLWSALYPAFMGYLDSKVDTNHDGTITNLEIAQAVANGTITTSDPHLKQMWIEYKRETSYYMSGWNVADVDAAFTQGKVAEIDNGSWTIYTQNSNTTRKFPYGFFPTVPVLKDTSSLVTTMPEMAPTGKARLSYAQPTDPWALVAASVKGKPAVEAAAIKWLQFITQPAAAEFIVNENPQYIPIINGSTPAPLWSSLNNLPVAEYPNAGKSYPYALFDEQQRTLQRETVLWILGQENDQQFFDHVQSQTMQFAKQYIAASTSANK